jgi:hypothetical protein
MPHAILYPRKLRLIFAVFSGLRKNFVDSEDADRRRSHPGIFDIDINSISLPIVFNKPEIMWNDMRGF